MSKRRLSIGNYELVLLSAAVLAAWTNNLEAEAAEAAPQHAMARGILEATGTQGGLIVHLGSGDGKLTAALGGSEGYLVHGLDCNVENVKEARRYVRSQGLYGKVSIDRWDGRHLPYTDNLVNLVVVDRPMQVPMKEVLRAIVPGGAAYVRKDGAWTKTVKPRQEGVDEWTHTLHGADGNAVANDSVVGPPHHIQWVGEPRSARQHEHLGSVSAVVSTAGRLFSIQDEGPVASIVLPAKWFLVARDAMNGVILWKKPIESWEGYLRPFRSGPPGLARRLVAIGNRIYVTLGYGEPVSVLDAASGKTVKTYEGTEGTTEIIYHEGVLFLVLGDVDAEEAAKTARRRGASPPPRNKRIIVIQADTGDILWKKSYADTAELMPTTLATSGGRVFFQNTVELFCLDAKTGKELWRAARPVNTKRPSWSTPTLVAYDEVVLSADRTPPDPAQQQRSVQWTLSAMGSNKRVTAGDLIAFSANTGERLWSCKCHVCYNTPVDVLVADGLVWTGDLGHSRDPGITVGRDPVTGEIKKRRPADQTFFQVGMPHHRCYRDKATNRYLVTGRAGVEFVELATGRGIPNHWVRGTCQFGILPCNGLLYAPPHSCACYIRAKLNGFNALAPQRPSQLAKPQARDDGQLERGPAYSQITNPKSRITNPADWPTHRHDAARSGFTKTPVPAKLRRAWQADLGGKLSSVTVAGGKVFVASVEDHTVHALDAKSGKNVWQHTAGGRVDSPPTVAGGLVLFGSADGWVYCLRAADGQLAWRFRAAPRDRRIVAYGQLESVWPVHGSVLVQDDVVWFAAGRSSYLDGGIRLYRLDLKTGKKLSRTCLDSRDAAGRQPKGTVHAFDLPGALPDVLSSKNGFVYMRHMKFDSQGVKQKGGGLHLFSPTGLLDDLWWHRSYWILGSRFYTGYRDWFRAGREVPAGRLLVFDQSSVYGFGRTPEYYYWSSALGYHLFATDREPKLVESPTKRKRLPAWGQRQMQYHWSEKTPLLARAMVLAGKTLFVAGPPELADEEQSLKTIGNPATQAKLAEQNAAIKGKRAGLLRAVSASDGQKAGELKLDSPPVFDGMAAAGGCLYLATMDGKVVCLGGQ